MASLAKFFAITFDIDWNFLKSNSNSKLRRCDRNLPQHLGDFLPPPPAVSAAAYCFRSPSALFRSRVAAAEAAAEVGAVFALNTLFHVLTFPVWRAKGQTGAVCRLTSNGGGASPLLLNCRRWQNEKRGNQLSVGSDVIGSAELPGQRLFNMNLQIILEIFALLTFFFKLKIHIYR